MCQKELVAPSRAAGRKVSVVLPRGEPAEVLAENWQSPAARSSAAPADMCAKWSPAPGRLCLWKCLYPEECEGATSSLVDQGKEDSGATCDCIDSIKRSKMSFDTTLDFFIESIESLGDGETWLSV
ncbi:hypothetical protein TREES_T100001936 [Tupaia chinensis]|uniref:Uncharacterized protein n=1 Tax=Tupaia chinensis TaxID=246437 RepID=L9JDZ0_TUPCH|nr:hypothetical protein TREES_T100001936 [Tupaia chinensis]